MQKEVLIVVITKDVVDPECLSSIHKQKVDWIICGKHPKHKSENSCVQTYLNCAENRESARVMALSHPAQWFLFVDSDIVLPDDAVEKFLVQTKSNNAEKRIIGGYYKRRYCNDWVCGKWIADNTFYNFTTVLQSLTRADLIGLGCAFMSREALFDLNFTHGTDLFAKNASGDTIIVGECGAFADLAQKEGYSLYMDGSIICGHNT